MAEMAIANSTKEVQWSVEHPGNVSIATTSNITSDEVREMLSKAKPLPRVAPCRPSPKK